MSATPIALAHWSRLRTADGVVFTEPRGRARLRVRSRIASARIAVIVAEVAESHGVDVPVALERQRLVIDGEIGVLAVGRLDCHRELAVALVGDSSCACVDGVGDVGMGIASLVEALANRTSLGRGARRVRMFEYTPPHRWRGLRREAASLWVPSDLPRVSAVITVHDARPFVTTPDERLHRWLFLGLVEREGIVIGDPVDAESAYGVRGRVCESRIASAGLVRRAAAFGDDQFLYQASIETRTGDHASLDAFDRLLQSIRPLPPALKLPSTSLTHWAE